MLPPALGQVVQVRSRRYLVESIAPSEEPEGDTTITLACLDDDAQGQALTVFWERELADIFKRLCRHFRLVEAGGHRCAIRRQFCARRPKCRLARF